MVAGLGMDFRGVAFGVMPKLFTSAEFVTKLTAVCTTCGALATRSQRLINGKPASYHEPIILVELVNLMKQDVDIVMKLLISPLFIVK